jgi:DNA-binding transcriptional ArsR family regulator
LPAGTLTRELKRLAEVGLLKQEKRGNQVLYSANRASPIFLELAGILRKTSGLEDVVAEELAGVAEAQDGKWGEKHMIPPKLARAARMLNRPSTFDEE